MCSNAKIGRMTISPGTNLIVNRSNRETDYKQWGIGKIDRFGNFNGQYNAQIEKLDTMYRSYKRSYVEFSTFYENNALFYVPYMSLMKIACVENEEGILVLTTSSKNTIVEPFHHRMPVILEYTRYYEFLNRTGIVEINYSLLKHVA